jgi:hypothetical protein
MAVPTTDNGILNWSNTFYDVANPSPTSVGLTAAQLTSFNSLLGIYQAALTAWNNDPQRSKSLTEAKLISKNNLISSARQLYNIVAAFPGSTDQQKVDLGVNVRKHPTPKPGPQDAPELRVKKVYGRQFRIEVRDVLTHKRAKPFGCAGYTLYSFTGTTPPPSTEGWVCEGNVTTADRVVLLPDDIAPGSRVYFTANWYGTRGEVGPGCTPVVSQVGIEGVQTA